MARAYRIELLVEGGAKSIRLNDCPTTIIIPDVAISDSVAIAPWLRSGENILTIDWVAGLHETAGARLELTAHEAGNWPEGKITLLRAEVAQGQVQPSTSPPGTTAEGFTASVPEISGDRFIWRFRCDVNVPRWRWLDSDVMRDSAELRQALMNEYEDIWTRLKRGNSADVAARLQERTAEYRTALFASPADVPDDYGLSAMRPDELFPLEPEDAELQIYAEGRLAEFVRWDGTPLIVYQKSGGLTGQFFSFVFRRQGGAFIVSR